MNAKLMMTGLLGLAAGGLIVRTLHSLQQARRDVPGRPKGATKLALEFGASQLQARRPLEQFHLYLVGFHPLRDRPHLQMEAHHYCRLINDDFAQCIIFDGDGPNARLTGVEYIASQQLYEAFPPEERRLWHPHNFEILSGSLVAPGLPSAVEKQLMRNLMNSYGKTWHFWMGETPEHDAAPLPFGEPCLAWSFNHDGEADERLVAARDKRLGVNTERLRHERRALQQLALPQDGTDALRPYFQPRTQPADVRPSQ